MTIEDAAKAVMDKGAGALLAKVDIQNAYRSVPVNPDDRWLLGTMWENALYTDTALPFGLTSAQKILTLKQEGIQVVLHYLDDYLLVGAPNSPECTCVIHPAASIRGTRLASGYQQIGGTDHTVDLSGIRAGLGAAGVPPSCREGSRTADDDYRMARPQILHEEGARISGGFSWPCR